MSYTDTKFFRIKNKDWETIKEPFKRAAENKGATIKLERPVHFEGQKESKTLTYVEISGQPNEQQIRLVSSDKIYNTSIGAFLD